MNKAQTTTREDRTVEPGNAVRSLAGKIPSMLVLLIVAWSVFVLTHEAGHLLGGWLSGARLCEVELRPWKLPYSLHNPDPQPLVTLWAGPIGGVVVPLLPAISVLARPCPLKGR